MSVGLRKPSRCGLVVNRRLGRVVNAGFEMLGAAGDQRGGESIISMGFSVRRQLNKSASDSRCESSRPPPDVYSCRFGG